MQTQTQYELLKNARSACRETYSKYFGSNGTGGLARGIERKLLSSDFGAHSADAQKMAVRAYFSERKAKSETLLKLAEKSDDGDEIWQFGKEMKDIGNSMESASLRDMRKVPLLSFLRAAGAGPDGGLAAHTVQAMLAEGSFLQVQVSGLGISTDPVITLKRNGGAEIYAGSLRITHVDVAFLSMDGKGAGKFFEFPSIPELVDYSGREYARLAVLEVDVKMKGELTGDPLRQMYALYYNAGKDYSRVMGLLDTYLSRQGIGKNEADRIKDSRTYSFSLRTPREGERDSMQAEGEMTFWLPDRETISFSISFPACRLYRKQAWPGGEKTSELSGYGASHLG